MVKYFFIHSMKKYSGFERDKAFGLNNLTAGKEMQMVKIERTKGK